MKVPKFLTLLLGILFIVSCATDKFVPEPKYNSKDPSLTRLMLFIGKDYKQGLFKKFQKKYDLFQRKYGKQGLFYPQDHAYTYSYHQNKIVKLVIAVQQNIHSSRLKTYTGPLPFNLYRRDTYESVVKKLGEPSSTKLDNTIIDYADKKLQIKFTNGTISTITIKAN
jgi:hypothetical protein